MNLGDPPYAKERRLLAVAWCSVFRRWWYGGGEWVGGGCLQMDPF